MMSSTPFGASSSMARFLARRSIAHADAPLPAPELDAYTPEQVAFAARAWTMRSEEEHQSATIFADALSLLVDGETSIDVLAVLT